MPFSGSAGLQGLPWDRGATVETTQFTGSDAAPPPTPVVPVGGFVSMPEDYPRAPEPVASAPAPEVVAPQSAVVAPGGFFLLGAVSVLSFLHHLSRRRSTESCQR